MNRGANPSGARLLRLGAVPTAVAALLLFGFGVTPPLFLPTGEPLLEWVRDPAWTSLNLLALTMALLLPLSLVVLYAAQANSLGTFGLLSFLSAFFGTSLYLALQFDESFVWPVLATEAPELLHLEGPMFTSPLFGLAYLTMGLLFIAGWLGFGVVTSRAGVFPRSAGVLLAIGMPVFGAGNLVPFLVRGTGSVLAAAGLALLARALWHDNRATDSGSAK